MEYKIKDRYRETNKQIKKDRKKERRNINSRFSWDAEAKKNFNVVNNLLNLFTISYVNMMN